MRDGLRDAGRGVTHYPLFDYLRIILAAGVFFRHGLGDEYLSGNFGNACVQVFFALSGFLIGTILLGTRIGDLPAFYFKRVVRIWIPYAIAIGLLMAGTLLLQDLHDPLLWQSAFYHVTFVTNIFGPPESLWSRMPMWGSAPHFWSICVEEQFYLLAPLVLLFLPSMRVPVLIAVVLLNFFVPHDFAAISLGVLLAIATNGHPLNGWMRAVSALLSVSVALATSMGWIPYFIGAPFGSVFLVAALMWPGRVSALGAFLGGMSYPFYLNHWIPLMMREKIGAILGTKGTSVICVAFVVALALSAIHYVVVDRQVLRARGGWYSEPRGRKAWAAGVILLAFGLLVGAYIRIHGSPEVASVHGAQETEATRGMAAMEPANCGPYVIPPCTGSAHRTHPGASGTHGPKPYQEQLPLGARAPPAQSRLL